MKAKTGHLIAAILILAALLTASVPGCAKEEPTVKGELVFGLITDYTGPLAGTGKLYTQGEMDAIKYYNEELGGVAPGVTIKPIVIDGSYDVAKERSAMTKLITVDEAVFVGVVGSASVPALIEVANPAEVVWSASSEPVALFNKPFEDNYFIGVVPMWGDFGVAGLEWWVDNKWKKSEPPKVALCALDNQAGWSLAKRIRYFCDREGYDYVQDAFHPVRIVEQRAEVATIKAAKPDVIIYMSHDGGELGWIKEWDASGIPGTPQIHLWVILTPSTLAAAGEAAHGIMSFYPYSMVGIDRKANKLEELRAKWYGAEEGKKLPSPNSYIHGFTRGLMMSEAAKTALKKVGFEGFSGAAFRDGFFAMKGFDCLGLTPKIDASMTERRAYTSVRLVEVVDAEQYILSPLTGFIPSPELTPEEMDASFYTGK